MEHSLYFHRAAWLLIGCLLLGGALYALAEEQDPAHVFTGTVQNLDRERQNVTLKTDLEKVIFFEVVRPDLLREVHGGDRLTVHLNEQGKADKLTKLALPELGTQGAGAPAPAGSTEPVETPRR